MSPSHLSEKARRTLRYFFPEIGFVNKVSKVTVDDDQLALRSFSLEELGLTWRNIAKKIIGPVKHGCGSTLTGPVFGGQVQTAKVGTTECVIMLMMGLASYFQKRVSESETTSYVGTHKNES